MATNSNKVSKKPRMSQLCLVGSSFTPRGGACRPLSSKTKVSAHTSGRRRILVVRRPPKCARCFALKACHPTAYRRHGHSSDSNRARFSYGLQNPYKKLEWSVYGQQAPPKSVLADVYKPADQDQVSSDSSDEFEADNCQPHKDDPGLGGGHDSTHQCAEGTKEILTTNSFYTNKNIQCVSFTELLRQRQTSLMETIAKDVSPPQLLSFLKSKGYFKYDYRKNQRTTSDLTNLSAGHSKKVQSLYSALGLGSRGANKTRMSNDFELFESPKNPQY